MQADRVGAGFFSLKIIIHKQGSRVGIKTASAAVPNKIPVEFHINDNKLLCSTTPSYGWILQRTNLWAAHKTPKCC